MSATDILTAWLDRPGTQSITFTDARRDVRRVSYAELAQRVADLGKRLSDVHPDRTVPVAVSTGDALTFVVGLFSCLRLGIPCSPLLATPPFAARTGYAEAIGGMVRGAGHATAVLAAEDDIAADTVPGLGCQPFVLDPDGVLTRARPDLPVAARTAPDPAAGPAALVQFTSGSTGTPRPIRLTAGNVAANVAAITDWVEISEDSLTSSWLPLHHDMGLIGNLIVPICAQAGLDLRQPISFLRAPLDWLQTLSEVPHALTAMPGFGLRTVLRQLDRQPDRAFDLVGWRTLILGAERVDPDLMDSFAARLGRWGFSAEAFQPAYGLAEATLAVTGPRTDRRPRTIEVAAGSGADHDGLRTRLVSCGRTLPGTTVEIVDEDGVPVPDGTTGEIRVGGPSVAAAPAGGLRTGDAGLLVDGELYVIGRFGDSLKVRGRAVFAEDVETALAAHDLPARHMVLLGHTEAGPVALVAAETGSSDWQVRVETTGRTAFPELGLRAVNVPTGTLSRTTSGKPRRQATWQRLVRDGLIGTGAGAR